MFWIATFVIIVERRRTNISIRLRTVEASTRAFERLWNIIFGNFFSFFPTRRGILSNRDILGSFARSFSLLPSKELLERPARLRFNIIVLFRWTRIEKRQTKMNLHGSFRSCSTKYTESLACTDGIARLREESWYSKSYLFHYKLPTSRSLTDFEYRDFYQLFLTGAKSNISRSKNRIFARYFFTNLPNFNHDRTSLLFLHRLDPRNIENVYDLDNCFVRKSSEVKSPWQVAFRGEYHHSRLCFVDGRIGFDGNLSNYVDPVNGEFS